MAFGRSEKQKGSIMNTRADAAPKKQSKAVAHHLAEKEHGGMAASEFVDRRPEAVAQKKLQAMATNSARVKQLRAIQAMADKSPHAQKAAQFQAMANKRKSLDVHQRKIKIESTRIEHEEVIDDPVGHAKSRIPYYVGPETIVEEVLSTKPAKVREAMEQQFPFGYTYKHLYQWIEAWHDYSKEYTYTDDATGMKKLTKDAIKFYLNQKLNWRSVGTAEYMTGDATGLAMAPTVDPEVTIKVLTGKQRKGPQMEDLASLILEEPPEINESNKEIVGPSFLNKQKQLPGYFEEVLSTNQVVMSDTETKKKYQGTSDRYSKSYNVNTPGTTKPWNKETWEATRIIGEAFKDEEKREHIRSQIRLGDTSEDNKKKEKDQGIQRGETRPHPGWQSLYHSLGASQRPKRRCPQRTGFAQTDGHSTGPDGAQEIPGPHARLCGRRSGHQK